MFYATDHCKPYGVGVSLITRVASLIFDLFVCVSSFFFKLPSVVNWPFVSVCPLCLM